MATIGTFKKTGSNEFTGEIVTLSVQTKNVRIVPEARATGENAPASGSTAPNSPEPEFKSHSRPRYQRGECGIDSPPATTRPEGTSSTQPPSRYTEATLVKTLEEKGIGRPSTYASIMQTIQRVKK